MGEFQGFPSITARLLDFKLSVSEAEQRSGVRISDVLPTDIRWDLISPVDSAEACIRDTKSLDRFQSCQRSGAGTERVCFDSQPLKHADIEIAKRW